MDFRFDLECQIKESEHLQGRLMRPNHWLLTHDFDGYAMVIGHNPREMVSY